MEDPEETRDLSATFLRWSGAEFKDFLDICKERKIGERLATKCSMPMPYIVFYDVAVDLQGLGYARTVNQILGKFKHMKKKYRLYRRELDAGRLDEDHVRPFPFFDLCNELLEPLYLMKKKADEEEREKYLDVEEDDDTMHERQSSPVIDENTSLSDSTTERINTNMRKSQEELTAYAENSYLSDNVVERIRTEIQETQKLVEEMLANHQQEMQEQQEEWRRRLADEEREFFNKVLSSFNKNF